MPSGPGRGNNPSNNGVGSGNDGRNTHSPNMPPVITVVGGGGLGLPWTSVTPGTTVAPAVAPAAVITPPLTNYNTGGFVNGSGSEYDGSGVGYNVVQPNQPNYILWIVGAILLFLITSRKN